MSKGVMRKDVSQLVNVEKFQNNLLNKQSLRIYLRQEMPLSVRQAPEDNVLSIYESSFLSFSF